MTNRIPQRIRKLWEHWNIRGVILLSLSMQIFLIMSSPLRKRKQKGLVLSSIWAAYLLADWAANFCVGLIASSLDSSSKTIISTHSDLQAFWAPFLLLHLGGPDTITAFSLEDNELWLRHLLGFIIQFIFCAYVFLLTVPGNRLWIPTVMVFVAGMIKYGERIYALYLASNDTFRGSMNGEPNPGSNYSRLMLKYGAKKDAKLPTRVVTIPDLHKIPQHDDEKAQLSDDQVVLDAYRYFEKFKGIIVDMIFSFLDRNECRQYFHSLSAKDALRVIEVELNFFYEAFYTKFLVVRSKSGYLSRFVAMSFVVAALGFFFSVDKPKQGFEDFDVRVTYALLCGAIALDTMALLMLLLSDRTIVSFRHPLAVTILNRFIRLKRPKWSKCNKEPYTKFTKLSTWVLLRRWNGSISGFNLISYSRPKKKTIPPMWRNYTIVDVVQQIKSVAFNHYKYSDFAMWLHEVKNPFLAELWVFIFGELKRKSAEAEDLEITQIICNSRGEWVLQEGLISEEQTKKLMPYLDANEVAFDESLILWHIATHLCYALEGDGHDQVDEREFSKLLSDYMLYLLVVQSNIISAVAGIGKKRFKDTVAEATQFFEKTMDKDDVESCKKLLADYKPADEGGGASKSLLFDACLLAKELGILQDGIKWRIICQVWVELLSFAACNCRISTHVQHLSKGGELISLVWLLMLRLGLGKQFQIKGAEAKLIVEK